jgi:curved DNA-binding protein CbpA
MGTNTTAETNYYEVLEVSESASQREIHSAYNRAKSTYSPDSAALYSMFSPEEARQLLNLIEEAFTILSNQSKRADYDKKFFGKQNSQPTSSYSPQEERLHPISALSIAGEEGAVLKPIAKKSDSGLPKGHARTKFGSYEVNKSFELELEKIDEIDGLYLAKIRNYKKVSIDQLSELTRISKSYLVALEKDQFTDLPAVVFVRGFVLQIARALQVPDRLADSYIKCYRKKLGN